ncbi:DUF6930 domain-containing protein [Sphaerochaeta halotolerans]|uniref:DUF6930 domain-containing protein n=1 Tax=Sphaerochaeta halotolerans TaxID=2293840 RepID=UPI001371614D|nr:hypothetical protein [Sphaerochaeta halotolerans]MXI87262.1 hypothetical protein [Sphaerochaeta halotolerans]
MKHSTLYELAKAYQDASIDSVFSENDLICILSEEQIPYYVSVVDSAFAAYRGEKGLTGYLALSLQEESASEMEIMDLQEAQECLLSIMRTERDNLEESDLKAIEESGVSFTEGSYPQFRIKEQYKVPWYISEQEEKDLILILQGLLFAKEYFASYKKTRKTNTFSFWLDSLKLEETEKKEYIPTLEKKGDSFEVSARVLQDEAYGFYYPHAFFTNEERQLQYKRMRAKSGKILALAIGMMAEPMLPGEGDRPLYPFYSLAYDPQSHQVLDVFLVEDYEREHGKIVSRLLELFEKEGKPQAIHCYGKRTLPLLSELGKQIGIMVVMGNQQQEMDTLIQDMFRELYEIPHDHDHHHHEE